jgi:4-nitrophenyl phosphatase
VPMKRCPLDELHPPVRGLILDMDGVLWKDDTSIGDLPTIFTAISSRQLQLVAATNNATKTSAEYIQKLANLGVQLSHDQIVTSGDATVHVLLERFPSKGRVYVVGEPGLISTLRVPGFDVVVDADDERRVEAVVAGLDRCLTYEKIHRAACHIREGAQFLGTNPDPTFPTPAGLIPGAGAIIAAIATASGVKPIVVGKPSPLLFETAAHRMGLAKIDILIVGDRLETDIAGGQAFGARTALVLSGVTNRQQVEAWYPVPDLITSNLAELIGA